MSQPSYQYPHVEIDLGKLKENLAALQERCQASSIEISGVVAAVDALDIMCKTADVELVTWERKLGGRLVTLIVRGNVSAVTQAVETASAQAIKKPVCKAVIANPHPEVEKIIAKSAARLEKKQAAQQGGKEEKPSRKK